MRTLAMLAVAGMAGAVNAQALRFNEGLINVPGGADNGGEFLELLSAEPNFDMTGITIVIIDGDNTNRGVIDQALSLDGLTTGSNGLFLWRDGATVLDPAPEAATTIRIQDFSPDIENGAVTFILVRGFNGAVGNDLDTNDDGTLDAFAWTEVIDVLGYIEGEQPDVDSTYAVQLGGLDISVVDPDPTIAFTADAFVRICTNLYAMDVFGGVPGPFISDEFQVRGFPVNDPLPANFVLTPGSANIEDCDAGCPADFNGDGFLDFFDYDDYVACFEGAGAPGCNADFNGDGFVDFFDYDDFVAAFEVGC
jgi:hypothetical protein